MTQHYTKSGSLPAPLPFRITLSDGTTRTDPTQFSAGDIASAGYVLAPDKPAYDAAAERVSWQDGAWVVEALPIVEPVHVAINKLEALALFRAITGMDDAGELAMRKDPNLELLWMKWATDVPQTIRRDNPVVGAFLDGLIATGHATPENKTAMLDAWPAE